MSTAFSALSSSQQSSIQAAVDSLHRPLLLATARLCNQAQVYLDSLLSSPSNQASTISGYASGPPITMQGVASDSLLGLLLTLDQTSSVPVATSGLSGAQPLTVGMLLQNILDLWNTVQTHNTPSARQSYALAVGAVNIPS